MGNALMGEKSSKESLAPSGPNMDEIRQRRNAIMNGGPLGLGDPFYRGLSKMEEDPVIPQRMRDIIRTVYCLPEKDAFNECTAREGGIMTVFKCRRRG